MKRIFSLSIISCTILFGVFSCKKENIEPKEIDKDTITVDSAELKKITILQQPIGDTITSNDPFYLTIKATVKTGEPISYQWYRINSSGTATKYSTKDSIALKPGKYGDYYCVLTTENDTCHTDTVSVYELDYRYFYGAEIYTNETYKYGRFTARMKMVYAPGCISSMFLYYNNSDVNKIYPWNEIDIEILGNDSTKLQSNIITGNKDAKITSEAKYKFTTSPISNYHLYTIEWTPEYVAWFIDNEEIRRDVLGEPKGKANGQGAIIEDQVDTLTERQSLRFNTWSSKSTGWVGTFTHYGLPTQQYIDYIKVETYDTDTKTFTEKWTDDFDTFDANRWKKGTWQMENVTLNPNNVAVEDGCVQLRLTKDFPYYKK